MNILVSSKNTIIKDFMYLSRNWLPMENCGFFTKFLHVFKNTAGNN